MEKSDEVGELYSMVQHFINSISAKFLLGFYFIFIFNLSMSMAEMQGKDDQTKILVIGSGTIVDRNVAVARKMAISEALSKGVEEYLARRLGDQGMINNFPRLIHEIIPRAREHIENFHILTEEQTGKHYKILVRLKVNEKVMEEKLRGIGLVLMEGPPIKVLFLVSQVKQVEGETSYWWRDPESNAGLTPTELALHRVFQDRGFIPINRLSNVPEGGYSSEMKFLDLSDEDAIRWGRLFSADVVVRGACEISEGEVVYIFLAALDVERDTKIYQDSQIERIAGGSEGLDRLMEPIERAISGVAIRLGPEIIRALGMPEVGINKLEITLKGLSSFQQFREFRDFLKDEIDGVKTVIQTKIRSNSISVSIEFSGKKEKFLEMVLNHEAFPIEADASETETGEIVLNVK